jgi:4-hydroxybenzoate polyprenyltransferase
MVVRQSVMPTNRSSLAVWNVRSFLSAAYHVALPMSDVVTNTLFHPLLGILVHSAGCVINDTLDRNFDRKAGAFQVAMTS